MKFNYNYCFYNYGTLVLILARAGPGPAPAQLCSRTGASQSLQRKMDEIFYFLKKSRVEESTLKELVVPALYKFGYRTIADLRDLERNDLNIEGQLIGLDYN